MEEPGQIKSFRSELPGPDSDSVASARAKLAHEMSAENSAQAKRSWRPSRWMVALPAGAAVLGAALALVITSGERSGIQGGGMTFKCAPSQGDPRTMTPLIAPKR